MSTVEHGGRAAAEQTEEQRVTDELWVWLWNIDLTATGQPHPLVALPGVIRPIPDLPPQQLRRPDRMACWPIYGGELVARGAIITDRLGVVRGIWDFGGPCMVRDANFEVSLPVQFWNNDFDCAKLPDVRGTLTTTTTDDDQEK